MAIPYRTAKFKSTNIFVSAAQDQTVKFKDRQYFRLYGKTEEARGRDWGKGYIYTHIPNSWPCIHNNESRIIIIKQRRLGGREWGKGTHT